MPHFVDKCPPQWYRKSTYKSRGGSVVALAVLSIMFNRKSKNIIEYMDSLRYFVLSASSCRHPFTGVKLVAVS